MGTTLKQDLYKYGVFVLSITGMVVNLGAVVHLVKQEWVQVWFPLNSMVLLLGESVLGWQHGWLDNREKRNCVSKKIIFKNWRGCVWHRDVFACPNLMIVG